MSYPSSAQYIWNYLMNPGRINNAFGVAAMMGNLQAESGLYPNRLQGDFTKGYTKSADYTAKVDNGTISEYDFVHNGPGGGGYGLAQWTWWSRKQNLYNRRKQLGYKSVGDIGLACDYLWEELQTSYQSVLKALKEATNIRTPSDVVLHQFERPADQSVAVEEARAALGTAIYNTFKDSSVDPAPTPPDTPDVPSTPSTLYVGTKISTPYICISGAWKTTTPYIYRNGIWISGQAAEDPGVPDVPTGTLTLEDVEKLIRSTKPEVGNSYYISYQDGGLNGYGRGNPRVDGLTALCNCTAFAAGAFNEAWYNIMVALGKTPDTKYKYNFKTNGNEFIAALSNPKDYNWGDASVTDLEWVTPDKRPPLGGIAVWGDTSRDYDNMNTNHVAFISRVSEDGNSVTFLQSGWKMPIDTWTCNIRESTRNTKGENMWWFQNPDFAPEKYKNAECYGFIVNPAVKEALGE